MEKKYKILFFTDNSKNFFQSLLFFSFLFFKQGKYLTLNFNLQSKTINSCGVHHFLLEKTRVVHHSIGERNYHCFYQMIHGASKVQKEEWKLLNVNDYNYLIGKENPNKEPKRRGSKKDKTKPPPPPSTFGGEKDAIEMQLNQDIENFHMTLRSLSDIGFDTEEIDNIFKLLVRVEKANKLRSQCFGPPFTYTSCNYS